jgi:hypothetical protein
VETRAALGLVDRIPVMRKGQPPGGTLDPRINRWWRSASFPPWRHRFGASFVVIDSCLLVRATPGETLNQGLLDWMMVAFSVALPLVGVVFGVDTGWRIPEAVWCSSTTSTTLGLGSVAQRGLGVG